jgi:hypothetical protein
MVERVYRTFETHAAVVYACQCIYIGETTVTAGSLRAFCAA